MDIAHITFPACCSDLGCSAVSQHRQSDRTTAQGHNEETARAESSQKTKSVQLKTYLSEVK
eukprot:6182208-Pleurochrysis_carterae.AAC.2